MNTRLLLLLFLAAPILVTGQALYSAPSGATSHVSSFENLNGIKGAGGKSNAGAKGAAFRSLPAGETCTLLDIHQAGIIQRIWMTVNDRSPRMLRALRLRIYWDGSAKPAVDVPLGDFFCAGARPVAFESALFSDPEAKSFMSFIPMPFATGARVTLANEGTTPLDLLFFDIDFVTLKTPPANALYFHACWNRTKGETPGTEAILLPRVNGKGRFLGVSVAVRTDTIYGSTWWGEGEFKAFLDGDSSHPSLNGTGAEDYIGTGWGEGTFAHQYSGCLVADGNKQYAFYRFHIPDPVWFYHDCRITMQQIGGGPAAEVRQIQQAGAHLQPITISGAKGFIGLLEPGATPDATAKANDNDWMNFFRSDDYSATAYFYLDKSSDNLPPLAPLNDRLAGL
jgi:D-arabinan exo alpha-(1,3)/(1,5)-arabinofuranosidase (non-reducing end)